MNPPPVVAVVGRSGSGKTTLLTRAIPSLQSRGLLVGVVKHHGHATPFDTPGKDTYRLSETGAEVVIGVSSVQVALFAPRREVDGLTQALSLIGDVDLVLAEGFSASRLPKVEVHRSGRSPSLLSAPEDLIAIVSDAPWNLGPPVFSPDSIEPLVDLLVDFTRSPGDTRKPLAFEDPDPPRP